MSSPPLSPFDPDPSSNPHILPSLLALLDTDHEALTILRQNQENVMDLHVTTHIALARGWNKTTEWIAERLGGGEIGR